MPVWPATLPQRPLQAGLSMAYGDTLLRFKPDVGREMRRERTTARDDMFQVSYMLTPAQRATFDSFFKTDLGNGSLDFTLPDPLSGAAVTVHIEGQVQASVQDHSTVMVSFNIVRHG
jgi:hypothetical protein